MTTFRNGPVDNTIFNQSGIKSKNIQDCKVIIIAFVNLTPLNADLFSIELLTIRN